jgi:hypothetical protein
MKTGTCINKLTLESGPSIWDLEIQKLFFRKIEGARWIFDFDTVIPVPPALYHFPEEDAELHAKQNKKQFGWAHWFDYCCDKWGCKGNGVIEMFDSKSIHFTTDYSPPFGIVQRLSELFPELSLSLRYHVVGTDILGEMNLFDGEVKSIRESLTGEQLNDLLKLSRNSNKEWEVAA